MVNGHSSAAGTLQHARAECDAARGKMSAAPVGSRRWLDAEWDLNFWQSKAATLAVIAGIDVRVAA